MGKSKGHKKGGKGRSYTVSLAVAASIIDNVQSLEYASYVAGQIARAAAIFSVDEVVVFDDVHSTDKKTISAAAAFLARVLQYLETPQYLRRALIPMHPDLRLAGQLPPLNPPHHLRETEWKEYREGVVIAKAQDNGCYVDIGLDRKAFITDDVMVNQRVTLYVGPEQRTEFKDDLKETVILSKLVSPQAPREEAGLYWGYSVRLAHGLNRVFKDCPYSEGYDLKIGTSEHGVAASAGDLELPGFTHMLIAFGGLDGLEACMTNDDALAERAPEDVFNMYINTCPNQGSRTIRTEEAVLISLTHLQSAISRFGGTV